MSFSLILTVINKKVHENKINLAIFRRYKIQRNLVILKQNAFESNLMEHIIKCAKKKIKENYSKMPAQTRKIIGVTQQYQ